MLRTKRRQFFWIASYSGVTGNMRIFVKRLLSWLRERHGKRTHGASAQTADGSPSPAASAGDAAASASASASAAECLEPRFEIWRFPDRTTAVGKSIDAYLQGSDHLGDAAVHLLFSANRWERHAAMEEALRSGTTLIVDRYAYSGARIGPSSW